MSSFKALGLRVIAGLFVAVICVSGAVPSATAQSYRTSGMPCANEDGRCNFSGSRFVRYGAGDRFTVRLLTDGTDCTNTVFGDPVPNVRKACYLESAIIPTRRCADEDGRCSFMETRIVFYGAGDRYTTRALTNGTACTNAVFGDPAPGVRKACYTEAGSPVRGGAVCANEGGRCAFNGSRYVYYGAGDRFAVRLLTNGADCTNAVFGDPTPGVRKSCYVDTRR
ncbi:MAG: hypothetical protein NT015_05850 [Alphaproteobacteria bacterium]|nr:hypothetical protein [Alphaproteobacteria bacterium]